MEIPAPERLDLTPRRLWALLGAGAVFWAVAILLWQQGGLDKAIQLAHEPLRRLPFLMDGALAVSHFGMTACVIVYLGLILRSMSSRGPKDLQRLFLPVLLLFATAGATGDLSKSAFDRPRPYAEHPAELTSLATLSSTSLPSGHATKSAALVLPFVVFAGDGGRKRKGLRWGLAAAAAAIAYTRILLGVHYLGDILAGIGTACLYLPVVASAVNILYGRAGIEGARMERLVRACGLLFAVLIFYLLRYT